MTDRKLFVVAVAISFAITSLYPVAMLFAVPLGSLYYAAGIDVCWTIYTWLFLPLALGLLVIVIRGVVVDSPALRAHRATLLAILAALSALVVFAVWDDGRGLANPDRLKSINGVPIQTYAFEVDQCLRNDLACGQYGIDESLLTQRVDDCRRKYGAAIPGLMLPKSGSAIGGGGKGKENLKHAAYYCALIDLAQSNAGRPQTATVVVTQNHMRWIALLLNSVIFIFVLIFVVTVILRSLFKRYNIELHELNCLLACWAILTAWFPFRLFADWKEWYGDLSHVWSGYPALFVVAFFCLVTFVFLVIDFLVTQAGAKPIFVISSVWGTLGAVFGFLTAFNSDILYKTFQVLDSLPVSMTVLTVAIIFGTALLQVWLAINTPAKRTPRRNSIRPPPSGAR